MIALGEFVTWFIFQGQESLRVEINAFSATAVHYCVILTQGQHHTLPLTVRLQWQQGAFPRCTWIGACLWTPTVFGRGTSDYNRLDICKKCQMCITVYVSSAIFCRTHSRLSCFSSHSVSNEKLSFPFCGKKQPSLTKIVKVKHIYQPLNSSMFQSVSVILLKGWHFSHTACSVDNSKSSFHCSGNEEVTRPEQNQDRKLGLVKVNCTCITSMDLNTHTDCIRWTAKQRGHNLDKSRSKSRIEPMCHNTVLIKISVKNLERVKKKNSHVVSKRS